VKNRTLLIPRFQRQLITVKPLIREKSRRLLVISGSPSRRAVAAIKTSMTPIGVPVFIRVPLISAAC
jgi:hypothetical protein